MADIETLQKVKDNPNVQKFLKLLAYTEGTDRLHGYNTLVGGKKFEDLGYHPNIVGLVTKDGKSTAAGRYQITNSTFNGLRKKYNFTNFSPQTQDLAALALINEKNALGDIIKGDFNSAVDKVKNVWVSLPNSSTKNQPEKSMADVSKFLGVSTQQKGDFADTRALNKPDEPSVDWGKIYQAYKSGKMSSKEARDFENYVNSGKFAKPPEWQVGSPAPQKQAISFDKIYQAYKDGKMSKQEEGEYLSAVKSGQVPAPKAFMMSLQTPKALQDTSILSKIGNVFTGSDRKVASTEALPSVEGMPEMNEFSLRGFKVGVGTIFSNPEETVKIIKNNNPAVEVKQDAKGNYLLKSAVDGKWYASKPGFRATDIPKTIAGVGVGALGTMLAAPTTIAGAVGLGAGTQAGIEATQVATGGEFNLGDVITSGLTGGAVPAAAGLVKTVRGLPTILKNAAKPTTLGTQDVSKILRGGGSLPTLAKEVNPSKDALLAAQALDVPLNPVDVTRSSGVAANATAIKQSNAASSLTARTNETLRGLQEKTNLLFDGLGVSPKSKASTVENLASQMKNTQKNFVEQVDAVSSEIKKYVSPAEKLNPSKVKEYLTERQWELGGKENSSQLKAVEKKILQILKRNGGEMTYGTFEQTRKDIGKALNNPAAFPDQDKGFLKNLYSKFLEDQLSFLDDKGLKELSLQQKSLVIERKNLEKNMTQLFGKDLEASFLPKLNKSIDDLAKGNPANFVSILKATPQDKKTTVAALGVSKIFETGKGGLPDFTKFNKWYRSVNDDAVVRREIRKNLPRSARNQLDNIYRITRSIEESQELGKLGAAEAAKALQNSSSVVGRVYEFTTRVARGNYRGYELPPNVIVPTPNSINTALGIFGALRTPRIKAADNLLASDEFVNLVTNAANETQKAQAVNTFSKSRAFKEFAKTLGVKIKDQTQAQSIVTSLLQTQNRITQKSEDY